jgi:predicted lysophospholipase L1 biosynthesis ABC-type transport system permease subunit
MIISIPTSAGNINLCLPPQILKVIACTLGLLMLLAGYALVNLVQFVMTASPEQFIRIILVGIFMMSILIARSVLAWKAGAK